MHISSSYAKILVETNLQPREFPQSGSNAKDVKERKKEKKKERKLVITMASYALQTPPQVEHASCLGQKTYHGKSTHTEASEDLFLTDLYSYLYKAAGYHQLCLIQFC